MKKVTQSITSAFVEGKPKKSPNTYTDGLSLWLFNNKIAEHREDGMYITNAGWKSRTTKERLNGLPNVSISQKKGEWYLNNNIWDGDWIKINSDAPPLVDKDKIKNVFDLSKSWISTDGWRGYEEPKYAVCGANDTGNWDDSPCPSDVADREIKEAQLILKSQKIPTKKMTTQSSNVFCIRHYVVVPPHYIKQAKELLLEQYNVNETKLLYLN